MYYNIINNFHGYDILFFLFLSLMGRENCKTFDKISKTISLFHWVDYLIYT